MSKKNFMKAMGTVSDATLNRYAKFERNLEKEKSNKYSANKIKDQ